MFWNRAPGFLRFYCEETRTADSPVHATDGDVQSGDTLDVDADLKKGEMKFEREATRAAVK
jgi:hypothetical protein